MNDADGMGVRDHDRSAEEPGFLDPRGAGQFAVAIQREPRGIDLAIGGFFALDMGLRVFGVLLGGIFAQRWGTTPNGEKIKHYYVPESAGIATGFLIAALHTAEADM